MEQGFYASEAARLAGFKTPLMLNYLERSGTFVRELDQTGSAKHHGKRRVFTFRDIVVLRAINRLLVLGARPQRIKQAMKTFGTLSGIPTEADKLMEFARKISFFIVTAETVIFCANEHELVDVAGGGQLAFSFIVETRAALSQSVEAMVEFASAVRTTQSRQAFARIAGKHGL